MPESGASTDQGQPLSAAMMWEVFSRLPDAVCVLDARRRLLTCNDQWRGLLAEVVHLLVPGTHFIEIIRGAVERGVVGPTDAETPADWIRRTLAAFAEGDVVVLRFTAGREMRVERTALVDGSTLITLTDVTLLRQQERALAGRVDELEAMQEQLATQSRQMVELAERLGSLRNEAERANRTKSEFLANMSHELRSPLNAIIGFAEIMKDQLFGSLGSAQYREYAVDIWSSGRHLLDLINDILDLSKIEAGKLDLVESRFDLAAAISACVRLVAGRAQQAEISVRSTLGAEGIVLWADERKIKQVLINLLTNAIKFTKSGGRVKVHVVEAGATLDLRITDTGIGIAKEDLPVALAAFGQVDSSLARKHEGTGLGLPLSKALVEMHGGTLHIDSEVGVGTTVTVKLPAGRVVSRASSAAA
jgi:two-component system, cell cycle sensor histidine kinase PleC